MESNSRASKIISALNGKLIVSCQDYIEVMVDAAIAGGASGLRVNNPASVRFVRDKTNLPILACNKMYFPNSPIYITPSVRAAVKLIEAGADMVALDCTNRRRVREYPKEIIAVIHEMGTLAVADLSSMIEAEASVEAGADILATTLRPGFDKNFIRELTRFAKPVLAEGHISTPQQAKEAIDCGAWAVCIGSAITRPHLLTKAFKNSLGD